MRRVAVTGLGVACPLGVGHEEVWARLLALEPALCAKPPTPAKIDVRPATAFSKPFPADRYADRKKVRKASDLARLAVVACVQCAADMGLPEDAELRDGTNVVLGTCFGGSGYYLDFHEKVRRQGLGAANAVLFTEGVFNAASGHVSAILGLHGPGLAIVGGEESGLSALVTGVDRVRLGTAPAALVGGAEEFCDRVQGSLLSEDRVGEALVGPFDRSVGPCAEGGAALALEPLENARARGARVYAEVLGVARARGGADPEALVRAARAALAEAGTAPDAVDLVVGGACGGAPAERERAALEQLGLNGARLCWPKTLLGEGFAFTSALQAQVASLALYWQTVPPTWTIDGAAVRVGPGESTCAPEKGRALERVLVIAASEPGGAVATVLGRS